MTQPPPHRPQGPYPPPGGYGSPGGGYGPPPGGFGPPPAPRQGPPQGPPPRHGPPQGPPPGGFYPPPGPGGPPPPPRKSSAGKIGAIVVVALVVLGVGGFALWKTVLAPSSSSSPDLTSGSSDTSGSDGSTGAESAAASCSLVATEDIAAVLGGQGWTALDSGPTVLKAYDSRVLAGVPTSCAATDSENSKLARIARYQGGDAAARFAEEKQKAARGGDDGPYLGKDVPAGDEAFCTTGSKTLTAGSSAGALVRSGDTLVYVSTTASGADDGANCDLSLKLVEKVHAP